MIAIGVLAPLLAGYRVVRDVHKALDGYYGPRGKLSLEQQISSQASAGFSCLIDGRYAEAEARYRSALGLNEELAQLGHQSDHETLRILTGLADSLVAQHRDLEAAEFLEQKNVGRSKIKDPDMVEALLTRSRVIRRDRAQ
jgi:hypothetical protein